MVQLVFFFEKDSVAARNMEISCWGVVLVVSEEFGTSFVPEVLDGMAFGSDEEVFRTAASSMSIPELSSDTGEAGGVG